MGVLESFCRNHLEEIREDISSYINQRLGKDVDEIMALPAEDKIGQGKKGGIIDRFLQAMQLNDDGYDADEFYDEPEEDDECDEPISVLKLGRVEAPKSAKSVTDDKCAPSERSSGGAACFVPKFLKKNDNYQEIDKILENKEESFSVMLLRLIDEKGLKDSEVYKNANIDRRLFSKIRGDEDYVPSKKTAISFCLALQLSLNEAKKLLATSGYTLSASSKFDLIIMYLLEHEEYNIHFANIVLDDYGEGTLSR